jgi:transcriptional regulator GlxA family with amidase domain
MAAACIGTFVMAESGLLDHHHATTTWWLAPLFRKRYPHVLLDESNMIVKSGRFVTAGAALSHIDLALWLVRGVSPKLASLTAKYLIVDSRPSQSAYALTDHLVHSDPLVQRFESWARSRLKDGFSLDEAADAVGASKRTLARRMQMVLGKSPLSYFQSLRVERPVHLLKTSSASVVVRRGNSFPPPTLSLRWLTYSLPPLPSTTWDQICFWAKLSVTLTPAAARLRAF